MINANNAAGVKVKVSKEVAEAIELVRQCNAPAQIVKVSALDGWGGDEDDYAECLNSCQLSLNTLITALYIGYEVEKSPQERLAEIYKTAVSESAMHYGWNEIGEGQAKASKAEGIRLALETLGLKIEGVTE